VAKSSYGWNCYLDYITKFTNMKKTLQVMDHVRWCTTTTTPLQSFIFCSCWVSGFVCVYPSIHFIMRISCFWLLCVYQISREDKSFFLALGDVEFLGRKHTTFCLKGMKWMIWGPTQDMGLMNSQQQQEACSFSILCLEIRKIFVQLLCLKAGRETLPNNVVLFFFFISSSPSCSTFHLFPGFEECSIKC
jgi:hypothetical protein